MNAILLALIVSFPRAGLVLPPVAQTYVIGAVGPGVTNVTVAGRDVAVSRTGAWTALMPVTPGTNVLSVSCSGDGVFRETNIVFRVERPRPPAAAPATNKVWKKLAYAGDMPRAAPVGRPHGEITVFLDPGHGGEKDTGAWSPHGHHEKTFNLQLAEEVRRALAADGFRVMMTRREDRPVDLYERAREAHEKGAACFVSIHHNAPPVDHDAALARYAAVYAWNALGDALARPIAARMDEVQKDEMPSKGVLRANFAVTRSPEVPSVLVEADFITHPDGEASARSREKRRALGIAIARGIADWVEARPSVSE